MLKQQKIYNKYEAKHADMIFTKDDKTAYDNATHCHICGGELGKLPNGYKTPKVLPKISPQKKVRDHCHITGEYCGACSLNLQFKL